MAESQGFDGVIYEMTRQEDFSRDFGLARQIQRAAVSIMSNVAEGFERGSRGEFHQFLSVAKLPVRSSDHSST